MSVPHRPFLSVAAFALCVLCALCARPALAAEPAAPASPPPAKPQSAAKPAPPKRPQVCEDAMSASRRRVPSAERLSLWDQCLATGNLSAGDNATALLERSTVSFLAGNATRALVDIRAALALAPGFANPGSLRRVLLLGYGRYMEQPRDYTMAVPSTPRDEVFVAYRSRVLLALGRGRAALSDLDYAVRKAPDEAWVYERRGDLLEMLGEPHRALLDYDKAVDRAPSSAVARELRGLARRGVGQYALALADLNGALLLDDKDAALWFSRGAIRLQQRQYRQARDDFAQALRLRPGTGAYADNLAWVLATSPEPEVRNSQEALRLGELAVAAKRTASSLDSLAAAQARAGRFAEAVRTEEEALAQARKEKFGQNILREFEQRQAQYRQEQPFTSPLPTPRENS